MDSRSLHLFVHVNPKTNTTHLHPSSFYSFPVFPLFVKYQYLLPLSVYNMSLQYENIIV